MIASLRRLVRDQRGNAITEFGLLAPVMLALFMGLGDVLYQAYLHNPKSLWDSKILDDARSNIRVRMLDPAGRPIVRTLSFHLAGDPAERYGERSLFGSLVSPATFGHQGQGGQIAWADPVTGISFCYLTNTIVFPPGGCFHPRARELSTLAAEVVSR